VAEKVEKVVEEMELQMDLQAAQLLLQKLITVIQKVQLLEMEFPTAAVVVEVVDIHMKPQEVTVGQV
jgi:hypothetical protein